jgi:malate dehydrogenase (oxaloacetate-decarboxylating)
MKQAENMKKASLALHRKLKGKIEIKNRAPVKHIKDLTLLYSPGVAEASRAIATDKKEVYTLTRKHNMVAVVSDGSAVLGLGNIGPEAALPVMEGKAMLFKAFADIDAVPIVLGTQNTEEIIQTVKAIAPTFGGINLEDISAPRCFEIEKRLKAELDIPVVHDDQHGTAIVVLAALMNALRLAKKDIGRISVTINGAGAAAQAIFHLLVKAGVMPTHIRVLDSKGVISRKRTDLDPYKKIIADMTKQTMLGGLAEAVVGTDVFIGVSVANVLTAHMVQSMNEKPIVFAMANPDPEISLVEAQNAGVFVFGTGRSDYPNQINNVLAFPGLFRGALDTRASAITDEMKLAAAHAIAGLVSKKELKKDYILPKPLDKRVVPAIVKVIKKIVK